MALPLSIHHDEDRSVLILTDSDDDDLLPPNRRAPAVEPRRSSEAMRQKTQEAAANVPVHPIPAMQPAFAESLMEATNNAGPKKPKLKFADKKQRRTHLLDSAKGASLHSDLWRYRPGQRYHEIWKLLAQVSFGVYLLLNGIANSNEQVVDILQHHIDEVDEFLETTLEDLTMAIDDVRERIECLKLPMENMKTFEEMLEDRDFRLQFVTGNEKIEHIIERTTLAMETTFKDVDEGLKAVKEFAVYLENQKDKPWTQQRPELMDIYDAMKGNAQGWYQALVDLQGSASSLDTVLINLGQIVAEMDQKAGEVSRRTRFSVQPFSGPAELPGSSVGPVEMPASPPRRRPSAPQSMKSASTSASASAPISASALASRSPTASTPQSRALRLDSPVEKEVVFFDEKEVAFVHPMPSVVEDTRPEQAESERPEADDGMYLLQPRTYTPQPPAPLPSPMIKGPPASQSLQTPAPTSQESRISHRASLRQRVSMKGGNLPEVLHVPARHAVDAAPSSAFESSLYQLSPLTYKPPRNSEYVSSLEVQPSQEAEVVHRVSIRAPPIPNTVPMIPPAVPSPRSDHQQYFYPVRASPHSPLQQRPHTSATNRPFTSHATPVHGPRAATGMSMLSNVTNAPMQNGKTVKKKKSAFGWLKKAFTLDDEEKEEFEARKLKQASNPYYEARSPKFLDGKRLPDPKRGGAESMRSVSRYR
ncbi:hypothetical protein GGS20DRAFT_319511 [Poronia punctata]|nr:hypothetical protein GGS20DRAFT_319511 [Poronia punctata]